MTWTRPVLLALLATVLPLTLSDGVESAAVQSDDTDTGTTDHQGSGGNIFMSRTDAASYFSRRSKRSPRSVYESYAERVQRRRAEEWRREYYEEQRSERENHMEEERDEQNERTRERTDQWRQYHYDGVYPSYRYRYRYHY
ncbi:unique cartilage matrix-associated protein-like [Megalops cyprinoides]|uniref:unique cartilage matrix-associated protein-like n=1 Tax=Megalops cyprinoides TaxID=118141 RepID=UPI001863A483|nr:unique cartilage matrix-associated protein-like [Megalops cyprinoides]